MRKSTAFAWVAPALWLLTGCDAGYQHTESGLQYKIFKTGDGPAATAGSTVKIHYTQLLHDTVTATTVGKLPFYKALIPGTIFPYDPFEVLGKGVRTGDSVVIIQRVDSLMKKGKLNQLPPNMKPEDQIIVRMKILKVFPFAILKPGYTDSLVALDKQGERKVMDSVQVIEGPKRVQAWLTKKNITAPVNAMGAYVELIGTGEGMQADSGKMVLLKYKVSTLKGKVLDTNMDTSFRRTEPLRFAVGSGYMPATVDRSIRMLKKGGHARIYIPAMVALREMPDAGDQPSYEDMVFEVLLDEVWEDSKNKK